MKLEKLLNVHVLTGIILGLVLGLYFPNFPMSEHKEVLGIVALIMGLKVVGVLK